MIDPGISRAFGTVITVGAGVVALKMVSSLGEDGRKAKSKPCTPTFTLKNMPSTRFDIKPIRWKL